MLFQKTYQAYEIKLAISVLVDRKIILTATVAIFVTFLVYIGLLTSLERPTIDRLPIPAEAAISIIIKENNLTKTDKPTDFTSKYVYIRGNGSFYQSEPNSNSIGKGLGKAEPTMTAGNHFAWMITNNKDNSTYFVDHVNGDIVSQRMSPALARLYAYT